MPKEDQSYFAHRHLLAPPTERPAYSDRTAWIMGQLSELAYLEFEGNDEESADTLTERLTAALAAGGFELVKTFNEQVAHLEQHAKKQKSDKLKKAAKTDTQAILVRSRDTASHHMAVLAFRGSEPNKVDWFYTDADAVFVKLPDGAGKIHRGFYESFDSVQKKVEAALGELPADLPLYVTGHSLGGALANVAGMELEKARHLAAVYTFGSPRVGDEVWASRMKVPLYRTVNGRDVVPLLPFSNILGNVLQRLGLGWLVRLMRKRIPGFIGYQHVGSFRHLTQDDRLLAGSSATLSRLADVLLDLPAALVRRSKKALNLGLEFGTNHFMPKYNEKLEKIALGRNPEAGEETPMETLPHKGKAKKIRDKIGSTEKAGVKPEA